MKVSSLGCNNYQKSNNVVTPRTTGYAAAVSMGVGIVSGISKNKSIRKAHKPFAYLATFFTAIHIGLIESYRQKYKKL